MSSQVSIFILQLLKSYGLLGLFLSSFLTALIFLPGFVEFSIPILISLGFNPFAVFLSMTIGAVLGGVCNYYIGYLGYKVFLKKSKDVARAKKWLDKWGPLSVLFASALPIPFPFDALALIVGFLKMDFRTFIIAMILGKSLKYSFFILLSMFGASIFLKWYGVI